MDCLGYLIVNTLHIGDDGVADDDKNDDDNDDDNMTIINPVSRVIS
jgi:hypothetical protein